MNRHICISGASRGLGLHLVDTFLQQGDRVTGLSRQRSSELDARLQEYPQQLRHCPIDLQDPSQLTPTRLSELLPLSDSCEVMVLNAARALEGLATDLNPAERQQLFQVNVFAAMDLGRQFIRNRLANGGGGSLIVISSVAAQEGFSGLSAYAATKGALEAWCRSLAREWGRKGIRVNAVAPGFMRTEMTQSLTPDQQRQVERRSPLGRAVDPHSVAASVCFLASDEAASISGTVLRVE